MTETELKDLIALASKAGRGPWTPIPNESHPILFDVQTPDERGVPEEEDARRFVVQGTTGEWAMLIAHAKNTIPRLAQMILDERADIADLERAARSMGSGYRRQQREIELLTNALRRAGVPVPELED